MLIFRHERLRQGRQPGHRRNVAEIIIAKQRNGPIGTANLAFLDEQHAVREHREQGMS